eukprot:GDKH01010967.1.p1 GENE.GDKH01010967.1~~GDKH01010967.1.p1  ORF type:complete len:428 (-),score=88.60 GDKH01010967.1:320-1603(-)
MRRVGSYLFVASAVAAASGPSGCLNEMGKPVPWFAAFKLPGGGKYIYIDSTMSEPLLSHYDLTEGDGGAIEATVASAVGAVPMAAAYNDDPPDEGASTSTSFGHSKGLVAGDGTGGFWMLHSVPNFPELEKKKYKGLHDSQAIYGQTFLCMSLDFKTFEDVGVQLSFVHPNIYHARFAADLKDSAPTLHGVLMEKKYVRGGKGETSSVRPIAVKGASTKFTSFSKSGHWGRARELTQADIYAGLIVPSIRQTLATQTWLRGSMFGAHCDAKHEVVDIGLVKMLGEEWRSTRDHSKWAVATSGSRPTVCLGGVNRMTTQAKRGGNSVCFESGPLHDLLSKSIVGILDDCTDPLGEKLKVERDARTPLKHKDTAKLNEARSDPIYVFSESGEELFIRPKLAKVRKVWWVSLLEFMEKLALGRKFSTRAN